MIAGGGAQGGPPGGTTVRGPACPDRTRLARSVAAREGRCVEAQVCGHVALPVAAAVAARPHVEAGPAEHARELGVRRAERVVRPDVEPQPRTAVEAGVAAGGGQQVVALE